MNKLNNYISTEFINKIKELGIDTLVLNTPIWKYRYVCYKYNYFMKYIQLPKITKNNLYEAVFIEFRILPHIEFLIRNSILKLGSKWSFTIVCGLDNYANMKDMITHIGADIKIIKLDYNNLTQNEYSELLTTESFWNLFYGEKLLIYQEDSLIFTNNITPFLEYDFIGAPFHKNTNDTPNKVGNGGFSIRTKNKMLEVIKKHRLDELIINSSTSDYMKGANLRYPPEDVYFSKNMQEHNIGDVANWETAYTFSSEQVFNPNSFGGHKFWISNDNWRHFLKQLFKYKPYVSKSDLNKYLIFKGYPLSYNKNKHISNAFDINIELFCEVNNINYINDTLVLEHLDNICLDGKIYHEKQLTNIFEHIEIYNFLNKKYVFYENAVVPIQRFVNDKLYNASFEYLSELLIKKKYDTLNDNYDIYLLVFIGNEDLGINLLNKIIKYKKINKSFNIAFCINDTIKNKKKIKELIKNNFDFYAIYYSKELGTDITPTLLMYNEIIKTHTMKHVLKFHTKSISDLYNNLTDYLLKTPLSNIINEKSDISNCVGPPETYIKLDDDVFNKKLKSIYKNKINVESYFVAGTIFYSEMWVFDKVLEILRKNPTIYLLNNLYENNSINYDCSPIHFLERLFGTVII